MLKGEIIEAEKIAYTGQYESFNIMPRAIDVEGKFVKVVNVLCREILSIVHKSLSGEVSIQLEDPKRCILHVLAI